MVIGHTVVDQLPVLKDGTEPRINENELIVGQYQGVVDGQVAVEFEILAAFNSAYPKKLNGKTIKASSYNEYRALILIFDDNTYVKIKPECDDDGGLALETENITVEDLRRLGLVKETDWLHYLSQQQAHADTKTQRWGHQQLANAVANLGRDEVKKLLES
jgi:hypothetical protein